MYDYLNDEVYFFPNRFKGILKNGENTRNYQARMSIKASIMDEFRIDINNLRDYVNESVKVAQTYEDSYTKLQADAFNLSNSLSSLREKSPSSPKIDAIEASQKEVQAALDDIVAKRDKFFVDFIGKVGIDYQKILKYREIVARLPEQMLKTLRGLLKSNRFSIIIVKRIADLVNGIQSGAEDILSQNMIGRYQLDKDRYKGNADIVKSLDMFKENLVSYMDKFIHDFPVVTDDDISHRIERANNLASSLSAYRDVLNQFASSLKPAKQSVADYIESVRGSIDIIKKPFNNIKQNLATFDRELNKQILNAQDVIVAHYTTLLAAKSKKDAYAELDVINQMVNAYANSLIPTYLQYLKDTSNLKPSSISNVFKYLETTKPEIKELSYQYDRLVGTYPELFESVPSDIVILGKLLRMPPDIPKIINEGDIKDKVEIPYRAWADDIDKKVNDLCDFARLYTGVKSLYPLTIGLGLRSTRDSRGRDVENIKYVEAMNALLNEALSGKSITAKKAVYVQMAKYFYPTNLKINAAYRMVQMTGFAR